MSALLSARVKGLISLSLNTLVSFSLFTPEKNAKEYYYIIYHPKENTYKSHRECW